MCGIVGYLGEEKSGNFVVEKLKKLEYRGYDSAGIASVQKNETTIYKSLGNISNLTRKIPNNYTVKCAIAHTRWATHGKPSETNSHPHSSFSKVWTIVHNGIIENYNQLKQTLKYPCKSDTDTEVVAELLEENKASNIDEFIDTFKLIEGSYAIVAINSNQEEKIYFAKNRSPLYIASNDKDILIASDPICFESFSKTYYTLNDLEYGYATKGKIVFFDKNKNKIKKAKTTIDDCFEKSGKEGYPHFMLKEILEQPLALTRQIKFYKEKNILDNFDEKFISKFDNIQLVGCGTAYHVALMGAKFIQKMLNIRASAEIASEFIYNEPIFANKKTLFIFVSQSGETADTINALNIAKRLGATSIALTNVLYSTLAKSADFVLPVCAGPEIAVASTKAYVCQLSALYMFSKNIYSKIKKEGAFIFEDINSVAKKILNFDKMQIQKIATKIKDKINPIFIGKDLDSITAKEASLKLKEVAYINSTDYPSGELKHGFLALVEKGTPLFVFATQKKTNLKTINASNEAVARGAYQITITNDASIEGDEIIFVDEQNEYLASILAIAPLQYLAYEVSIQKGINPDQPRNLAKSVTVE